MHRRAKEKFIMRFVSPNEAGAFIRILPTRPGALLGKSLDFPLSIRRRITRCDGMKIKLCCWSYSLDLNSLLKLLILYSLNR